MGWHQVCLRNVAVTCCVCGQGGASSWSWQVKPAYLVHKHRGTQVETCRILLKALKSSTCSLFMHLHAFTDTHTACNITKSLSLIIALFPCAYANDLLVGVLSVTSETQV